jgi:hypothetical protein
MNKKFISREKEQEQHASLQQQQQAALEFPDVEHMLRHDALHTPVPPNVAHRLQQSVGQSKPQTRAWWKRLFGR